MKYQVLTLVVLLILLLSCSDNKIERLLRLAESEMSTYKPSDSALVYLEAIDFPEKLSEKDYAKYIFLLTKAHYRNKISIENDTLISVSVEYYRQKKDVWSLAESCLYAGRIYEVRGEMRKAQAYFSEAYEQATLSTNYEQSGRCAYGLGELYMDIDNFQESINWLQIALDNFKKSERLFHEINTLRRMGDYYVIANRVDAALPFFYQALSIVPDENKALQSDLYKNIAIANLKVQNYDVAIASIKKSMLSLPEEKRYPLQYNILADIYVQKGLLDSAVCNYKKVIFYTRDLYDHDCIYKTNDIFNWNKEQIAAQLGLVEKYRLYKTVSDSIYQKQTYEPTPPPTQLYNKKRLLLQNKILSERNKYYIILLVAVLAVIPLIIYRGIKLLKKKRLDLIDKENVIKMMELEKKGYQEIITTYKISNEEILKSYMRMVQLSISPKKNRYKNFLLEYNKVVYNCDEEFNFDWAVFCELLNNAYSQYIDSLKLTFIYLSDKEIQSIAMQKAGFEIADIAELFGYSIHTVYKRNSEIRKKIGITESGNIIEYIDKKLVQ